MWSCYYLLAPSVVFSIIFLSCLIYSCWSPVSSFVCSFFLSMPYVCLETPWGPSLLLAPRNGSFCDVSWGDASSNNLPNALFQVSNNTWIGLVCHSIVANGISCTLPLFFLVVNFFLQRHALLNYRFALVFLAVDAPSLTASLFVALLLVCWCTLHLFKLLLKTSWLPLWFGRCSKRLHCWLAFPHY